MLYDVQLFIYSNVRTVKREKKPGIVVFPADCNMKQYWFSNTNCPKRQNTAMGKLRRVYGETEHSN
jgi:hypothetical protein